MTISTDNLVCPGDVLEYCTVDCDESAGQSSVDTIIEGGTDTYVVLKNGIVLHPMRIVVRKVKFYNGCNEELIPNPPPEWHRLDECTLQSVIDPVNFICPGNMADYCTIEGDKLAHKATSKQSLKSNQKCMFSP